MLFEKYNDIYQDPSSWKYYSRLTITDNPFESLTSAASFIEKYIEAGAKGSIIQLCEERSSHVVSVFFLGLLVKKLNLGSEQYEKHKFLYFWFLTCLCHDFGYSIENNKMEYPPKRMKFKHLLSKLNIEYDLLKEESSTKFSPKTIKKYYDYCRYQLGFINHGIIGGIMLYDSLKKNYYINRDLNKQDNGLDSDEFERNGLKWKESDIDNFKRIADIIICHNIWYATDETNRYIYKRHKLDLLILRDKNPRLSFTGGDALLFLLLLTDTIDPIKFFNQLRPIYVLKNIDIEIEETTRSIEIVVTSQILNYAEWFCRIEDLEKWLSVKVEKIGERRIIIRIL